MARGPRAETRPADVIGCAIAVARIATGEAEDDARVPHGRRVSGLAGAAARAEKLTAEQRSDIARQGAAARWNQRKGSAVSETVCDTLARRFDAMKSQGLVDVKFFFRNREDATTAAVCAEVNAVLDAYEDGKCNSLKFNDSRHN